MRHEEDRQAAWWDRSEACDCVLVPRTWGYKEPRSRSTLVVVSTEDLDELTRRTRYRCNRCGTGLEQTEEDHAPTTWERG